MDVRNSMLSFPAKSDVSDFVLEGTLMLEHEGQPTAIYKVAEAFLCRGRQGIRRKQ